MSVFLFSKWRDCTFDLLQNLEKEAPATYGVQMVSGYKLYTEHETQARKHKKINIEIKTNFSSNSISPLNGFSNFCNFYSIHNN